MVDDPIEIDATGCPTHRDLISSSYMKDIFFVRHDSVSGGSRCLVYIKMDDGDSDRNVYFSIIRPEFDTTAFYIKNERDDVNRDRFIDFVLVNYPDHFEWILFHPEWLQ